MRVLDLELYGAVFDELFFDRKLSLSSLTVKTHHDKQIHRGEQIWLSSPRTKICGTIRRKYVSAEIRIYQKYGNNVNGGDRLYTASSKWHPSALVFFAKNTSGIQMEVPPRMGRISSSTKPLLMRQHSFRINRIDRIDRINRINRINRVDRINRINRINRLNRIGSIGSIGSIGII